MGLMINSLNVLRITNRRARLFIERLTSEKINIGSGGKSLRSLRAFEIRSQEGTEFFVGLKVDEREFRELTFEYINDFQRND